MPAPVRRRLEAIEAERLARRARGQRPPRPFAAPVTKDDVE